MGSVETVAPSYPPSLRPSVPPSPCDVRQPDDFPLFGPLERWISNPFRLIALQQADRRRIAGGIPTKHDDEIASLFRSDLSPQVGRYYPVRSHLDESAQRNIRTVGRRLVDQWIAAQPDLSRPDPDTLSPAEARTVEKPAIDEAADSER